MPTQGWQAELNLAFGCAQDGDRTFLSDNRHSGPLRVQRPFYPEQDGTCHVYLLHPPGGVVGGDELSVNVRLSKQSRALLTTPAAGKFYRSPQREARQEGRFEIGEGALLEWLPQEAIVYEGARLYTATRVYLHGDARFIGWEIFCLGRPAADEKFLSGYCRQAFEIWRDGTALFIERSRHEGNGEALTALWGLQSQPVVASFVCAPVQAGETGGMADRVRSAIDCSPDLFCVTQLKDALLCRYLGPSAEQAKTLFTRVWSIVRPALLDKSICAPRVWNT